MPRSPPLPGPPWAEAGRMERIQLDSSGAGADGQDAQRGAVAEGAGLVREAMLHCLVKLEEVSLKSLPRRVVSRP